MTILSKQQSWPDSHTFWRNKRVTVVKESDGWWIGWLLDIPGVNAQERTKEELIESLRIGAEDMVTTKAPFDFQGAIFP